jgi:transcriptional regulator with PAS, ATPase and Fis domain
MAKTRKARQTPLDLLNESPLPVYMLDAEWRITFANQPLADWVGLSLAQVIGSPLRYTAPAPEKSRTLMGLCPPPDIAHEHRTGTVSVVGRDGRLKHRSVDFLPLAPPGEEATLVPLMAVVGANDKSATELVESRHKRSAGDALHQQLLSWRQTEAASWSSDLLIGTSRAIVRVRQQVRAATLAGVPTLVLGNSASDVAMVARAIHFSKIEPPSVKRVPRTLLAIDFRLASSSEQAQLLATARHQTSPTTVLIEYIDLADESQQQSLATELDELPDSVQPIATVLDAARLALNLSERFSTIVIDVPGLAKRSEDLPLLAHAIVERANALGERQIAGVSAEALDILAVYDWPGGHAEFEHILTQAHSACKTATISAGDLPAVLHHALQLQSTMPREAVPIEIDGILGDVERWLVERALSLADGNKAEASRLLGISRPRLYRRLETLDMLGSESKDDDLKEDVE